MSAMNGLGIAKCHYPLGVSSARTGKASIPPITLAGTRDGSMQMATSQDLPLNEPNHSSSPFEGEEGSHPSTA